MEYLPYSYLKNGSNYSHHIPDRMDGLLILLLQQKIDDNEIEKQFTYENFKQTLREIGEQRIDDALHRLTYCFIDKFYNKGESRYVLTQYAENFINLIRNELNNPQRDFPLIESFRKYALLNIDEIEDPESLERWHEQGFSIAKRTISDRLGYLNKELTENNHRLVTLLRSEKKTISSKISEFKNYFDVFGITAREIKESLDLSDILFEDLEKIKNKFQNRYTIFGHNLSNEDLILYREKREHYSRVTFIIKRVTEYFKDVEIRYNLLNERILFADEKLQELSKNFEEHFYLRTKIKQLLAILLIETETINKREYIIPDEFKRAIPMEDLRFLYVPKYDFELELNQKPLIDVIELHKRESSYHQKKVDKAKKDNQRLHTISKKIKEAKQIIERSGSLDLSNYLFEVMSVECDYEIVVKLGFDIIQFFSKNENYQIEIIKIPFSITNDLTIWKMKIYLTPTS